MLAVGIHLKWEFKHNWVIRNNTLILFALFNQSEEYKLVKKRSVRSKTKMLSQEQKWILKKELLKKILKYLIQSVNPTMYTMINVIFT